MPQQTNNTQLIMEANPKSPISEAYRYLRTNIDFSSIDEPIRTIMVTSAQPGEGKSTTVANLAMAYAQSGKNVLLIDADLRKPTIHKIFNKSNRSGLTTLLSGQHHLYELPLETHIDNLSVLTAGPSVPNPSEILSSKRMESLIADLEDIYDIILIDTPPAVAVTDAQIIASLCSGVILVVDSGRVKKELALRAKAALQHVKAKLLGVVLNNKNRSEAGNTYYYYYGN